MSTRWAGLYKSPERKEWVFLSVLPGLLLLWRVFVFSEAELFVVIERWDSEQAVISWQVGGLFYAFLGQPRMNLIVVSQGLVSLLSQRHSLC